LTRHGYDGFNGLETSVHAEQAEVQTAFSEGAESSDIAFTAEEAALQRTSLVAERLGVLWAPPSIRALVQEALNTVTCEGETILVTLPVDHRIGTDIESGMLGITVLGSALIVLILCFLYFFHLRSAIKASSPVFLIGTVIGLLMLFISGSLLTRNSPNNVTCSGGWWMLNLGFIMTFGPLFAKCWRIYKIFMRKEMTVVRITDLNLMTRFGVLLLFEIVSLLI
jgi:heme/copper-type cytochrome/quinol oxidase subunit 4